MSWTFDRVGAFLDDLADLLDIGIEELLTGRSAYLVSA